MARKKKKNKLIQGSMGLLTGTMTASIGSQVLGGIGNTSAVHGQQAMTNLTRFAPMTGTLIGGGYALDELKKLGKASKKRKRRL